MSGRRESGFLSYARPLTNISLRVRHTLIGGLWLCSARSPVGSTSTVVSGFTYFGELDNVFVGVGNVTYCLARREEKTKSEGLC